MAAADSIKLTYTAEIADLRRKLSEIPDITAAEARKAVKELNKSIRAATKAPSKSVNRVMSQTRKSFQEAERGASRAAEAAGDFDSGIQALAAGLDMVDPKIGQLARTAGDLAGAFEGSDKIGRLFSGTLSGPIVVGLAVAVTALSELENVLAESREEARKLTAALDGTYQAVSPERVREASAAWRAFNEGVQDSRLLLLQETGELSALDVQQQAAIESAREAARVKRLEIAAREASLKVQKQELQDQIESGRLDQEELTAALQRVAVIRSEELPAAEAATEAINEETAAKIDLINENFNEIRSRREAAEAARELEQANRDAAAANREAAAEAARAAREEEARLKRFKREDAAKKARVEAEAARREQELADQRAHEEQMAKELEDALQRRADQYRAHGQELISIGSTIGAALVDQETSLQEAIGAATRSGAGAVIDEIGQLYLRRAAIAAAALQFPQAAAFASAAALAGVAGGIAANVQIRRGGRAGHRSRR